MHRTRIKICGITREQDLDASVEAGADAVGFVFYSASPRRVDLERAASLAARVPPFVSRVGLFVNPSPMEVEGVLAHVPLDLLQFHGDEDAAFCAGFGRNWIKAARVTAELDLVKFAAGFAGARGASGLLLDAFVDGYGGGGRTFDWSLVPQGLPLPVILSGGLNPDNVGNAVSRVRPWAVDVSSGVERSKGVKDARKIFEFVAGVRNADAGPAL